jgi:hypothetical protein
MSKVRDLRQRRQALETELSGLRQQRERAFRANSDALSRQRAGVTDHNAGEMQKFADEEIVGDPAMTALRRQIELIDHEFNRDHGGNFASRGRRTMKWLRK